MELLRGEAGTVDQRQQVEQVRAAGRERRHTEAGGDVQPLVLPAHAVTLDRRTRSLGALLHGLGVALHEQREFVAADAEDLAFGADQRAQQRADRLDHRIARGVPGGVVDHAEVVEVEVGHAAGRIT